MQEVLPGTVFVTYSYRVKDAGSGKRLQALATSVNQVWNFINEVSMKSARRLITASESRKARLWINSTERCGNCSSVRARYTACTTLPGTSTGRWRSPPPAGEAIT